MRRDQKKMQEDDVEKKVKEINKGDCNKIEKKNQVKQFKNK